mmetsp:Transcript_16170/g.48045  ORF Transcript_16170/g.48045 Transcript_16170/m.48045 type:complete len:100 (-) Transcript_16170:597-896(-)
MSMLKTACMASASAKQDEASGCMVTAVQRLSSSSSSSGRTAAALCTRMTGCMLIVALCAHTLLQHLAWVPMGARGSQGQMQGVTTADMEAWTWLSVLTL